MPAFELSPDLQAEIAAAAASHNLTQDTLIALAIGQHPLAAYRMRTTPSRAVADFIEDAVDIFFDQYGETVEPGSYTEYHSPGSPRPRDGAPIPNPPPTAPAPHPGIASNCPGGAVA